MRSGLISRSPHRGPAARATGVTLLETMVATLRTQGGVTSEPDPPENGKRRLLRRAGERQPAFSPDGRWISIYRVLEALRDIWIMPAGGGPPSRLTDNPTPDIHPTWSPADDEVAYVRICGDSSSVWIAPLRAGDAAPRRLTASGGVRHFAWDGSSGMLLVCAGWGEGMAEIRPAPCCAAV